MDLHSLQFQAFLCQQRRCHGEVIKEPWNRWQLPRQNNFLSAWDATENKQLISDLYFIHCKGYGAAKLQGNLYDSQILQQSDKEKIQTHGPVW